MLRGVLAFVLFSIYTYIYYAQLVSEFQMRPQQNKKKHFGTSDSEPDRNQIELHVHMYF